MRSLKTECLSNQEQRNDMLQFQSSVYDFLEIVYTNTDWYKNSKNVEYLETLQKNDLFHEELLELMFFNEPNVVFDLVKANEKCDEYWAQEELEQSIEEKEFRNYLKRKIV